MMLLTEDILLRCRPDIVQAFDSKSHALCRDCDTAGVTIELVAFVQSSEPHNLPGP